MLNTVYLLFLSEKLAPMIVFYYITFIMLVVFVIKNNVSSFDNLITSPNFITLLIPVLFLLNLAGIPPLPGFFIKLIWLSTVKTFLTKTLITIIVVFNFSIFYLYLGDIRLISWSKSSKKTSHTPTLNKSLILATILLLLSPFSVINYLIVL